MSVIEDMGGDKIGVAATVAGSCASAMPQGAHDCATRRLSDCFNALHKKIGPYSVGDINVVAGFDIDSPKAGLNVSMGRICWCDKDSRTWAEVKLAPVLDLAQRAMVERTHVAI